MASDERDGAQRKQNDTFRLADFDGDVLIFGTSPSLSPVASKSPALSIGHKRKVTGPAHRYIGVNAYICIR